MDNIDSGGVSSKQTQFIEDNIKTNGDLHGHPITLTPKESLTSQIKEIEKLFQEKKFDELLEKKLNSFFNDVSKTSEGAKNIISILHEEEWAGTYFKRNPEIKKIAEGLLPKRKTLDAKTLHMHSEMLKVEGKENKESNETIVSPRNVGQGKPKSTASSYKSSRRIFGNTKKIQEESWNTNLTTLFSYIVENSKKKTKDIPKDEPYFSHPSNIVEFKSELKKFPDIKEISKDQYRKIIALYLEKMNTNNVADLIRIYTTLKLISPSLNTNNEEIKWDDNDADNAKKFLDDIIISNISRIIIDSDKARFKSDYDEQIRIAKDLGSSAEKIIGDREVCKAFADFMNMNSRDMDFAKLLDLSLIYEHSTEVLINKLINHGMKKNTLNVNNKTKVELYDYFCAVLVDSSLSNNDSKLKELINKVFSEGAINNYIQGFDGHACFLDSIEFYLMLIKKGLPLPLNNEFSKQ